MFSNTDTHIHTHTEWLSGNTDRQIHCPKMPVLCVKGGAEQGSLEQSVLIEYPSGLWSSVTVFMVLWCSGTKAALYLVEAEGDRSLDETASS